MPDTVAHSAQFTLDQNARRYLNSLKDGIRLPDYPAVNCGRWNQVIAMADEAFDTATVKNGAYQGALVHALLNSMIKSGKYPGLEDLLSNDPVEALIPDNDETSLVQYVSLEHVASIAEEARGKTALERYQEGLSDETLERQRYDLALFTRFLKEVHTQPGDFYYDLEAWRHINAGLVDGFLQWLKQKGYAIGSLNVRLATVKAYCKVAHDAGVIPTTVYTRIQGVKGIPRKSARHVDKRREITRLGTKKASPVDIPDLTIYALKHPDTGALAARDTLLMCLLLDHGLRVGEVAILKKTHISITNRLLTFDRPKVSKDAELHLLTDDTYAAALAYLPTIPDDQESLFDLAVSSIQERVRMLGRAVGIPNLSPHDCRHSYADRAARGGATLDALMQAGGWSNYQTPLGYLKRRAISNDGIKL